MLPLQLLLFAKPIDIPFVSTTLSNNAIYLDHPVSYNPALHHGYRYQNPHNPPMGGLGSREAERRRTHLMDGLYGGYARQTVTKKEDVQRQQVQDVFENLKSGLDVEEQEPGLSLSFISHTRGSFVGLTLRDGRRDHFYKTLSASKTSTLIPPRSRNYHQHRPTDFFLLLLLYSARSHNLTLDSNLLPFWSAKRLEIPGYFP